jgi:glycosyltransferase involved in cell wall biosynthesis
VRLLFFKERLAWPRSSGHDVHSFHMMKALADLGHEVSLVTVEEPAPEAIAGLALSQRRSLAGMGGGGGGSSLTGLRERFRSYWGIDPARIEAVSRAADECGAEAVVVVGLGVLPYLGSIDGPRRVWYAGDEWVWHHLSQVRASEPASWGNLRDAAVKGLYERAYAPLLDRVWVVSEADRRALGWVLGSRGVDVVPNGIDGEHFRPIDGPEDEQTCVFWGRLDFGPNVQALRWFCHRVWPALRRVAPGARFTIYGFNPTDPVRSLAGRDGIELVPDLPDLRGEIARHQVVVLPFVSGGGIKNKLLEAAAMGKAIVASPHATNGLDLPSDPPVSRARTARRWVEEVSGLWADPGRRRGLGEAARRWVLENHTWEGAARVVLAGLGRPEGVRTP